MILGHIDKYETSRVRHSRFFDLHLDSLQTESMSETLASYPWSSFYDVQASIVGVSVR